HREAHHLVVAPVPVDQQHAAEPAAHQRVERVVEDGEQRRGRQRHRGREQVVRAVPVRQRGQPDQLRPVVADQVGGRVDDRLGEHRVRAHRQVLGVLLLRADGEHGDRAALPRGPHLTPRVPVESDHAPTVEPDRSAADRTPTTSTSQTPDRYPPTTRTTVSTTTGPLVSSSSLCPAPDTSTYAAPAASATARLCSTGTISSAPPATTATGARTDRTCSSSGNRSRS